MKKGIKNIFTGTQKVVIVILCIVCTLFSFSCQNKSEADQPLSDEQISSNLSKMGEIDPGLLIGEWDLIAFAYTGDGNKISDVAAISKVAAWVDVNGSGLPLNRLTISDDNPMDYGNVESSDRLSGPWVFWPYYLYYSISENLISYSKEDYPYYIMDTFTDEGYDVLNALRNTYSFFIKNDELIIYFIGAKNKNLLILKKR